MTKFFEAFEGPNTDIYSYIPDLETFHSFSMTNQHLFKLRLNAENSVYWINKCQQVGLKEPLSSILFQHLKPMSFKQRYLDRLNIITLYVPVYENVKVWSERKAWNFIDTKSALIGRPFFFNAQDLFKQIISAPYCYEFNLTILEIAEDSIFNPSLNALVSPLAIASAHITAAIARNQQTIIKNPFQHQPSESIVDLTAQEPVLSVPRRTCTIS